jgi:hypothetical protein
LKHTDFALLACYLRFDEVDLLLSLYCLSLDFLDKLVVRKSVQDCKEIGYLLAKRHHGECSHLLQRLIWDRHSTYASVTGLT